MVRTVVFPREGGSLVTNSRAMWVHGLLDTGRGCKRPAGGWLEGLFRTQTEQAFRKVLQFPVHRGPPEALFDEGGRASDPGVARQLGGVTLLQDPWTDVLRHKTHLLGPDSPNWTAIKIFSSSHVTAARRH